MECHFNGIIKRLNLYTDLLRKLSVAGCPDLQCVTGGQIHTSSY